MVEPPHGSDKHKEQPNGAKNRNAKPIKSTHNKKCTSIYDKSSLWSKYTYNYLWPLNAKVRRRAFLLRSGDFDKFAPCSCLVGEPNDAIAKQTNPLAREWQKEIESNEIPSGPRETEKDENKPKKRERHSGPSLCRAIARTFLKPFLWALAFLILTDCLLEPAYFFMTVKLIETIGRFPGGQITSRPTEMRNYTSGHHDAIRELSNSTVGELGGPPTPGQLYLTAGLFCVSISGYQLMTHFYSWGASKVALRLRIGLSEMLYAKALNIDKVRAASSELKVHFRQAVNLISRDLESLEENILQIPWVISAPLQSVILTLMVSEHLDLATAMVAFLVNVVVAVQRGIMNIRVRRFTHRAAQVADTRANLISEAIEAIRLIRMYAWTRSIEEKIDSTRREELSNRKRVLFVNSLDVALFFISCSASAICSLIFGYYVRGLPVTQSMVTQVFLVSAFYRRLLARQLPQGVLSWMNVLVVIDRCQRYLSADDQQDERLEISALEQNNHHEQEPASQMNGALAPKERIKIEAKPTTRLQLKQVSFTWPQAALVHHQNSKKANKLKGQAGLPSQTKVGPCFSPVEMEAKSGELVLIAGRVGSGKSTLLQVILGELAPTSGLVRLELGTKIAYASQEAWIFSGSVRDNILFGKSLNLKRYVEVLRVCSLLPDLRSFPDFDRTQIGQRGVTLSGGQKARVNLARALYQQADLYLLDDPLSAVDGHVARHIFEEALRKFLAGKTIILVTHQVQYLNQADKILYLNTSHDEQVELIRGPSNFFGAYEELERSQLLIQLLRSCEPTGRETSTSPTGEQVAQENSITCDHVMERILSSRLDESQASSSVGSGEPGAPSALVVQNDEMFEVTRSRRRTGSRNGDLLSVSRAVGFFLSQAGGWRLFSVFFLVNVGSRFFFIGTNIFLNFWAGSQVWVRSPLDGSLVSHSIDFENELASGSEGGGEMLSEQNSGLVALITSLSVQQTIWLAVLLWLCIVLVASARSYLYYSMALRAILFAHRRLVRSILWARMSFFDRTPAGHLINRISADTSYMDTTFLNQIDDLSLTGFSVSFLFLSVLVSAPKITLVVVLVAILVCFIFKYLTSLMETTKYLDGFRRAALYSHIDTTLDGLSVIRSSSQSRLFEARFAQLLNSHTSVRFINLSVRRCIIGSLDWILVLFYISLATVDVYDTLNGFGMYAFVGINLCAQMTRLCSNAFTRFVEFYLTVQSVDRIREYANELEHEHLELLGPYCEFKQMLRLEKDQTCDSPKKLQKQQDEPSNFQLANFPRGAIKFRGVSLKYLHTNKVVLKNLSFDIEPGSKVGIVGRTGAGKTSLITVLFHLYHFEGFIYIDEQDTKELQLESLRRAISIIPQDPTLFSGTIRSNLDPFGEHQDEQLWRSLEVVQLKRSIQRDQLGLNSPVSESGGNFSVGQRQLICLARAILKQNKILVLDEATANIDHETDSLIQRAIRTEFSACTVLTIAHRLNTIIDSDKIMIMDGGELCEFGSPRELLASGPDGLLWRMIESTGASQAEALRAKICSPTEGPA